MGSPSMNPIMMVSKVVDGYLVEVDLDGNLKTGMFQSLVDAFPDYARIFYDGLYRVSDIYLKVTPQH